MSRFLNEQEAGDARQQLIDAGYTENGANAALKEHQDKYRSTTDSISQHIDTASAIRLGVEGLGAGLGVYGGIKLGKGIYDRMFRPPEALPETSLGLKAPIEPMMDVSQRPVGKQEPRLVGNLFPENPSMPLNKEMGNLPKDFEIFKQGTQNTEKNINAEQQKIKKQNKQVGINPFEGASELRTGTGKPAYEGMNPEGKLRSTYGSIKEVPKGLAFIPNAQYVDVLRNDLGQPTYTESFKGRELPTKYRGAPEAAVETAQGINRSLNRETRESMLARGVPKNELPEPTKGILERIGGPKGSKIVTIGGAVGALTAIPNLVHAAQGAEERDLQKAWGSLVEGASQFLGPIGAIGGGLFGLSPEELDTLRKSKQSPKIGVAPPAR